MRRANVRKMAQNGTFWRLISRLMARLACFCTWLCDLLDRSGCSVRPRGNPAVFIMRWRSGILRKELQRQTSISVAAFHR
jgi:hypothetical protein